MHDYASLPTLVPVMDRILGYLSVKERVRCKGVCRSWRAEIELRERKSDTLVLHLGPYPWNIRWTETNNGRLMKFENSFQIKRLAFLVHPMTRALLAKTKKLAIVNFCRNDFVVETSSIQAYLGLFKNCVEIEFRFLRLEGTLCFVLPKLKVLVFNNSQADNLVLNCPSLEVLFWNWEVNEIFFENAKKLKRLICFGWPAITLNGKFDALEYLNVFTARDERVSYRLLDRKPKLKRLVLYSSDEQADLKSIRQQQKRFDLKNLEVLLNGFRHPIGVTLSHDAHGLVKINHFVGQLFENYSKLVEDSPWLVSIDYSQLFSKFKILPSNFFERFSKPYSIEISAVASYTHLLGFLKCYPFVEQLKIRRFSKLKAERILDLVHSLQPSIKRLVIVEDHPSELLKIEVLSFRLLSNLTNLFLECTHLPFELVRQLAAKKGPHFQGIIFNESTQGHALAIHFNSQHLFVVDLICGLEFQFGSVVQFISGMKSNQHLRDFFL